MPHSDTPYFCCELFDYTCIVPKLPNGNTVMVQQFRPAIHQMSLEWPAGLIDKALSPEATAIAELQEETGWITPSANSLGVFHADSGRLNNQVHMFACHATSQAEGWTPETGVDVIEVTPQELEKAIAEGSFCNALHVLAWHLAKPILFNDEPSA
jgi:ADP-ribose pyrophosphatase